MDNKEPLVVYWAPAVFVDDPEIDWANMFGSLIYPDPKGLHSTIMGDKNPQRGPTTFISCPAALNTFKKTFVFYNSMESKYSYDLSDVSKPVIEPFGDKYLNYAVRRPPATIDKPTVEFQLRWIFFCEESTNMEITPPMFHQPKYTRYGTCVPGQYDIGSWYRPFIFEIQMWQPKGQFVIEADEPLFYATFSTDRPVVLKRYKYTQELNTISKHLILSHTNEISLEKRYDLFNKTSQRELILKHIKDNLFD